MRARDAIALVLAFYEFEQITSEQVVAWADEQIFACDLPDSSLFDLSLEGPDHCLRMPRSEFPVAPMDLSFAQRFSAHALALKLDDDAAATRFAVWASLHCMGDDLEDPLVELSYMLDHLLYDLGDLRAALNHLRSELPTLLTHCKALWPYRFEQISIENGHIPS